MFNVDSRITAFDPSMGRIIQKRQKIYWAIMVWMRELDVGSFRRLKNTLSTGSRIVQLVNDTNSVIIEFSKAKFKLGTQPKEVEELEYNQITIRFALPFGYHDYFYEFDTHHVQYIVSKFRNLINESKIAQ